MPSKKSETNPRRKGVVLNFEAIGTQWTIELFGLASLDDAVVQSIARRIQQFDAYYSRFRKDSLVTHMSRAAGTYKLPPDAQPMLDMYQELYEATDGKMTLLIGQALSDAGYDADYSLKSKSLQSPPAWDEVITYKFPVITLKRPALLDFGAMGKGYLVDIVAAVLQSHGIQRFLINAGGDILHHDTERAAEVGLEHPGDTSRVIGVVELKNQSLCGSAGNRRKWGAYHHILDPVELRSPKHIAAVWVCADTAILADALTTALFFIEPEALLKHYMFSYAIVRSDYSLDVANNFPATFFMNLETQ